MTISDERLADARARFIGAKLRVDDEGMVEVPLDYLDEAILAFEEVQQSRTTADTEQDGKGVKEAARFLIERLDDFERGSLGDDIEDACRDFDGHVSPAIERLRDALSTLSNAPQQEVFDDRDALISAVTEEQYRHGETGLELETMAAHNAVLIKALEAVAADVVGIGNGENAISDASRLLVESALTSPPPVDPAPSQDGVRDLVRRFVEDFDQRMAIGKPTDTAEVELVTEARAALEAALNKGGE